MRPRNEKHMRDDTSDATPAGRLVCRPDLLTDGPARAVARLIGDAGLPGDQDHIGGDSVAGLVAAVEAYDLAAARVQWCQACSADSAHPQADALRWHEDEQHRAYVDLLATLRQSTGSEHLTSADLAS